MPRRVLRSAYDLYFYLYLTNCVVKLNAYNWPVGNLACIMYLHSPFVCRDTLGVIYTLEYTALHFWQKKNKEQEKNITCFCRLAAVSSSQPAALSPLFYIVVFFFPFPFWEEFCVNRWVSFVSLSRGSLSPCAFCLLLSFLFPAPTKANPPTMHKTRRAVSLLKASGGAAVSSSSASSSSSSTPAARLAPRTAVYSARSARCFNTASSRARLVAATASSPLARQPKQRQLFSSGAHLRAISAAQAAYVAPGLFVHTGRTDSQCPLHFKSVYLSVCLAC